VEVPTVPYEYLFQSPSSDRWGNLPRVPRVAGYSPKALDTIGSLQLQMTGELSTPYQEMTPPLQAEEMGQQT
jgi:hypothetical protein